MLAWPGGSASFWSAPRGSRSCREAGSKCGGRPNGTLLSILRAAASASQALILLLWKGARPEDGQVCPYLGLLLALLCACAQLLCLPLWRGKKNGMTAEQGEDHPASLEHWMLSLPRRCATSVGSQDSREAAEPGTIIFMIAIIICIS